MLSELCYSMVNVCAYRVENEVFRNWTLHLLLQILSVTLPDSELELGHGPAITRAYTNIVGLYSSRKYCCGNKHFLKLFLLTIWVLKHPRLTPELQNAFCGQPHKWDWELLAVTSGTSCQMVIRAQKSPWTCLSRHVMSGTSAASYPWAWFSDLLATNRRAKEAAQPREQWHEKSGCKEPKYENNLSCSSCVTFLGSYSTALQQNFDFFITFFFFFAQICNYTNIWYYIIPPPRFCFFIFFLREKKEVPVNSSPTDINGCWLKHLMQYFPSSYQGCRIFSVLDFFFISSRHPFYFYISYLFVL